MVPFKRNALFTFTEITEQHSSSSSFNLLRVGWCESPTEIKKCCILTYAFGHRKLKLTESIDLVFMVQLLLLFLQRLHRAR